jgi:hypothetical protein
MTESRTLYTIVGDVHHRCTEGVEDVSNIAEEAFMQTVVKSGEWLVKQHHPRCRCHGACQCHTLGLTAGELGDSSPGKSGETEPGKPVFGNLSALAFPNAA